MHKLLFNCQHNGIYEDLCVHNYILYTYSGANFYER